MTVVYQIGHGFKLFSASAEKKSVTRDISWKEFVARTNSDSQRSGSGHARIATAGV